MHAYQVGEEVVATLAEVATLLGVSKVSGKDVAEGGKFADQVQMVNVDGSDEDEQHEDDTNDGSGDQEAANNNSGESYSALPPGEKITATPEEIAAEMPTFKNLDELKEFIKDIDTPTLEYMARGLGMTWNGTDNPAIHRMRIAQAWHRHFFPDMFKPKEDKKKKAKFGDYTTEHLYGLVTEHKLNVKRSGNEPIDRMRAIQALKTVGVLTD